MQMQYLLNDGRRLFVRNGIGNATFKTFYQKPGKRPPHALPSPKLPWRDSETEAQADLDAAIAEGKGIFRDAAVVGADCARHCKTRDVCCMCPFAEPLNLAELKYGDKITLTTEVSWTNSVDGKRVEHSIPAGAVLKLETQKPEGWSCRTENGDYFFLFNSDLKKQGRKGGAE